MPEWNDWKLAVAIGAAGYATGKTPIAGTVAKTGLHMAGRAGAAALGTTIAGSATGLTVGGFLGLAVSSVALGYASGAAVGSVIARVAFGEQGASTALEFYSNPLNVVDYYWSGDFITDAQKIAWSYHPDNV